MSHARDNKFYFPSKRKNKTKHKLATRTTSSLIRSLSFRICLAACFMEGLFKFWFSQLVTVPAFLYWYHPFIHPPMHLPYPPHVPISVPIYPLTLSTHSIHPFIHPSAHEPFPPTPSTHSLIHPSICPLIHPSTPLHTHPSIQFLSLHLRMEEVSFVHTHTRCFSLPLRLFCSLSLLSWSPSLSLLTTSS